jgi:hypothetical protein
MMNVGNFEQGFSRMHTDQTDKANEKIKLIEIAVYAGRFGRFVASRLVIGRIRPGINARATCNAG